MKALLERGVFPASAVACTPIRPPRRGKKVEIGACAMGQSAAVRKAVTPAGEVVLDIMEEATRSLERVR
jgi:hypothetical protein